MVSPLAEWFRNLKGKLEKMNTRNLLVGCCLALGLAVAACGGATDGVDGRNGDAGVPGATGPTGTSGPQGTPGVPGTPGTPGTPGATGPVGTPGAVGAVGEAGVPGTPGSPGAPGDQGEQGVQGSQGDAGVSLCGDVPMPQWHQPCGVDLVNACADATGEWECHLFLSDGQSGDVTESTKIVCADSVTHNVLTVGSNQSSEYPSNPVSQAVSTTCDFTDCNGVSVTTGAGANVALVRPALTYLSPVQDSQAGGVQTFLPGLCRNATEHCIASGTWCETSVSNGLVQVSCDGFGQPETAPVSGDREGVVLSDFGDLGTPAGSEALMGTQCVNPSDPNGSVRLYTCSVDANGVASVTCTGSIQ